MNMKAIALTLLMGIVIGSGTMLQINRLSPDMKSWFVDKGPERLQ